MKRILITCSIMAMGACATTGTQPQQMQSVLAQQCAVYAATLQSAAKLKTAGKLSPQAVKQISVVEKQLTPLCSGPAPADIQAATVQITTAIAAIQGATK